MGETAQNRRGRFAERTTLFGAPSFSPYRFITPRNLKSLLALLIKDY
jgi:hypothetical protein